MLSVPTVQAGPDTRERLLDSAEERFAEAGYRAASVREITQAAQCNLAAVNYHFGSKGNLYRDVFLRRLRRLREQRIASLRGVLEGTEPRTSTDEPALDRALRSFVGAFLEPLVEPGPGRRWVQLVAQEMRDPQLPARTFLDEMIAPVENAVADALQRLCPGLERAAAELCTHSLVAQLVHVVNLQRCWRSAGRGEPPLAELRGAHRSIHRCGDPRGRRRGIGRCGGRRAATGGIVLSSLRLRYRAALGGGAVLASLVLAAGGLAGCAHLPNGGLPVPPAPDRSWQPLAAELPAPTPAVTTAPAVEIPQFLESATVSLAQVVDIALRNSPITRETWLAARAAADEVGSRRADLLPRLDFSADLTRQNRSAVGGQFTYEQTTWGPTIDLSYLLFDFGGRAADVQEARRALIAADFTHNAAVQDVVLTVEQAYYLYASAREARAAAEADLAAAKKSLESARARHDAGLATLADVLQARTAVSRAQLAVDEIVGQMHATKGSLATAMGLPADIPVDVEELPHELPVDTVEQGVTASPSTAPSLSAPSCSRRAPAPRPRWPMSAASAPKRCRRSRVSANAQRIYYPTAAGSAPGDNWGASLLLSYPLFTGWKNHFDLEQAKRQADAAQARSDQVEQQVRLQVWTSYYALQTASQRVRTSRDLLASAEQSLEVAQGRYEAGVGNILEVLTAQSALADAHAQEVAARADWLLSVAQLARDTGSLAAPGAAAPLVGAPQAPAPPAAPGPAPRAVSANDSIPSTP